MDIVKICPPPMMVATDPIFGFCALMAALLIWRIFSRPELPSWGMRGRRG